MRIFARPPRMREKRREATIERIVETALHLLETEGYESLTIQRLAKELGYAVGALYRYFRSKDALLVALLHRVMEGIGEDMQTALALVQQRIDEERASEAREPGLTSDEGLLRLLVCAHAYVDVARLRPSEFGLISTLIGDPREFLATEAAAPLVPMLIRLQLTLASVLEEAVRAGALAPGESRERAVILWSAVQGVIQLRKLGRFGVAGVELERLVPIALDTLLLGWGAKREQLDHVQRKARDLAKQLELARAEAAEPSEPEPTNSPEMSAESIVPDLRSEPSSDPGISETNDPEPRGEA